MKNRLVVALLFCVPAVAAAQTLTGVKVEPGEIRAGESAKITSEFDVSSGSINCGLRLHFGDGNKKDYKINQEKDVPLVVNHVYANPGVYEVKAEPKRNEAILGCMGKNQKASLKVAALPAAAPATTSQGPHCPEGWKLDSKSVNRKTGAFTCSAKVGTAMPEKKSECPKDLGYFETPKKGLLGCRQ